MIPATPGQSDKQPMHIPLNLQLFAQDGAAIAPTSVEGAEYTGTILHLTERTQTAVFHGIQARPVVSINRSFSAPINLHFDQSPADLALLARHETDHFARWQALTDLALPNLLKAARDAREGNPVGCETTFVDSLIAAAADESLEPAFRAQALALPSEADIARELGGNNDPDAIHAGRQAVMKQVADAGRDTFAALYDSMTTPGTFSPDATSAGRRALRNAALTYLSYAENSPVRAKAAFDAANNMTDLLHALTVLAHRFPDSAEAAEALSTFRDRFSENALVIDKWFSVQATIPGGGTLDRVLKLMENPLFTRTN